MRALVLLCALLWGLAPIPALAGEPDSGVAALIRAYENVSTLSAAFVQESRFAGFNTVKTFKGQLELTRPDRMRWDYRDGSNQQIYVDGRQVTVYAPSSEQAIVTQLTPASDRQIPLHLLADVTGIEDTYHVAQGAEAGELVLTLREPDPKAPEAVHLWLDPDTHLIARVRLLLPGGSQSDIAFSGIDTKTSIDPARYRFDAPKGVHVVHPSTVFPSAR